MHEKVRQIMKTIPSPTFSYPVLPLANINFNSTLCRWAESCCRCLAWKCYVLSVSQIIIGHILAMSFV